MAILHAKSPDGTQKDIDIDSIVTDVKTGSTNGTLSVNGTDVTAYTHPNSGVTADTYGPTANVTGTNNTTLTVPEITVNAQGHITGVTERTYTSKDTTYSAGTAALLNAGTNTTNRVWTAKILSDFVESKCTPGKSIAANGYVKFDSGLIIQWGSHNDTTSVTFPIAFPSACYSVVMTCKNDDWDAIISVSKSSFTYNTTTQARWIAIGK